VNRGVRALEGLLRGGPLLLAVSTALSAPLDAGTRRVLLHARDGSTVEIAQVTFTPRADGRTAFALKADASRFTDYFLSMREFKCLPGATEILCLVPYPYPQPGHVAPNDLAWLEHSLLFMFKKPSDFGAQMWNGVYFRLAAQGDALVGTPQAIDLNRIATPAPHADVAPFDAARRDEMSPQARWFNRLTIVP
jgi:hypothetical protein